ncbi:rod shape-determining protein, partial [Francisella tularensis subsp. holarctica]
KNNINGSKKKPDTALGTKINIISGLEEARLVYVGARDNHDIKQNTLVIDIGGGSTEFVIVSGNKILIARSLDMGCVGMQMDFFA